MKSAIFVGFMLIAFNNFASAQTFYPHCDPMELLEAKGECVPPSQEGQKQDENSENDSDANQSTDSTLEQIENKH